MDFVACIGEQVERLVHPAAHTSAIVHAQHRTFIGTRLLVSLGAVALLPFYLAAGSIPGWTDSVILAWLVLPIVAVVHVAKSGDLVQGEILSAAAWSGLALTLCIGGVCGPGPSVALLAMVLVEANLSERIRVSRIAISVSLAATLLVLATAMAGWMPHHAFASNDLVFYVLAMLYGAALSFAATRNRRLRQHSESLDAMRYQVLSEAIGDLVMRYDRSGSVVLASESAERLFGIKARDLRGRGFFDRLHVADRPAFLKMVSDAANGADGVVGTLRLRLSSVASPDGRYQEPVFAWVEMRTHRVALDPRATAGDTDLPAVTAVVRDVTTRMRHAAEIEQARRDAEEASAWKDRFLATVSHELRTPLNAIIGFGEMLASETHVPADAAKRREYADIIHQSGQHLLSVVNSLLDLSKIDAGKYDLIFEPFDLGTLIGSCCDMMGLKAEQSGVRLDRDLASCEVVGDKRACRQILINLLSNALKFTPARGTVTVGLTLRGDEVTVTVQDTGIGIPAGDLKRLGDPFFQVENGNNRSFEGTGLGLSVVSGLVGLHGGTIAVDSAPGEGTRMTVRLPRVSREQKRRSEKARIEVIPRVPRPAASGSLHDRFKVQKIA